MLIFQGFVICAIETFGTCIFVMKIPSMTHPYMVILLTNCVFIMPAGVALYNAIFRRSNQSTQSVSPRKKSVFFGIAFFLELTGIGLTVTLWTVTKHSTALENIWYPVAGIVCLSIAWVPEIQSFLLKENHADKTDAANESNSVNNGDQNQENVGQSSAVNQNSQQERSDRGNREHDATNGGQNQEDVGQSSAVNQNSQQERSDRGNREHDATNGGQNQEDVGQSSAVNQNSQQKLSDGGNREHDATNGDQTQEDVGQSSAVNQNSQQKLSDGGNREHDATNGGQNQEDVGQSSAVNQNSQQERSDRGNREHVVDSLENQRETSENGNCALQKPTWKMVIYMSFLKIVFTFVFSFILLRFAIFDSSVDATAVSEHFKSGWYGWEGFEIYYFIVNGCSSLLGYVIGFIACTTCMQKGAYAMPLFLATPLAAVLYSAYESCVWILHHGDTGDMCLLEGKMNMLLLVGACSCLVFAQYFSFGYFIIKSRPLVKQDEAQVSFLVNCRQASS